MNRQLGTGVLAVFFVCFAAAAVSTAQEIGSSTFSIHGIAELVDLDSRWVFRPVPLFGMGRKAVPLAGGNFVRADWAHDEILGWSKHDSMIIVSCFNQNARAREILEKRVALPEKLHEAVAIDSNGDSIDELAVRGAQGALSLLSFSYPEVVERMTDLGRIPPDYGPLRAADIDGDGSEELWTIDRTGRLLVAEVSERNTMFKPWLRLPDGASAERSCVIEQSTGGGSAILISVLKDRAIISETARAPGTLTRNLKPAPEESDAVVCAYVNKDEQPDILLRGAASNEWALYLAGEDSFTRSNILPTAGVREVHVGRFRGFSGNDLLSMVDRRFWSLHTSVSSHRQAIPIGGSPPDGFRFFVGRFKSSAHDGILAVAPDSSSWYVLNDRDSHPLQGVRVTGSGGHTAVTNEGGGFSLGGLTPGSYQLTAALVGHAFDPTEHLVTVSEKDVHGLRFSHLRSPPPPAADEPALCTGFNPDTGTWGYDQNPSRCGQPGVVLGVDDSRFLYPAYCCPAPARDLYTNKFHYTKDMCNDGYLVAGVERNLGGRHLDHYVCREVNTTRYLLGPVQPGQYWGLGGSFRRGGSWFPKSEIPSAIRYTIGRDGHRKYDFDGCVGAPIGSLFVGKTGKRCPDTKFRVLRRKWGDGSDPLRIVPECKEPVSMYDPDAWCDPLGSPWLLNRYAFRADFDTGVRVAACDVDADGRDDVVAAPGPGNSPEIAVFSGADGELLRRFFAYDPRFKGGVYVDCADMNGDGHGDIVTGAGVGGGPHIRAFSGKTGSELESYFAHAKTFRGGILVAACDLDGDKKAEIIAGYVDGGAAHAKAYRSSSMEMLSSVTVGGSKSPASIDDFGLSCADVNGDGLSDLLLSVRGSAGAGSVYIYETAVKLGRISFASPKAAMFPEEIRTWMGRSLLRTAVGDLDGDEKPELVVSTGPGARVGVAVLLAAELKVVATIPEFDRSLDGGLHIAVGDLNADGRGDIVTGAASSRKPLVRAFSGRELLPDSSR